MIEFKCRRYSEENTPVLSNGEIDQFAEMLLRDYKPTLLKEPSKINAEHFIESYLGGTLDPAYIYTEDGEGRIYGATSFNHELIRVFNREDKCVDIRQLKPRTVVIDLGLYDDDDSEGFLLFTTLHEAGHLWMHSSAFRQNERQMDLFSAGSSENLSYVSCCRREDIAGGTKRRPLMTPRDFREHQANRFAAAIAMPNTTAIPLLQECLKSNGLSEDVLVKEHGLKDVFIECTMIGALIKAYGVTPSAAGIKIKTLKMVMTKEEYENRKLNLI